MDRKIIISALNFPGVQSLLWHGHLEKIWTKKEIQDLTRLDLAETMIIILGAFASSYPRIISELKKRDLKVGIFWTSSLGQMEQVPKEIELFNQAVSLLQKEELDFILCGDEILSLRKDITYTPYPISFSPSEQINIPKKSKVGLFLPPHPRKNILNQVFSLPLLTHKYPTIEIHSSLILPYLSVPIILYSFIQNRPTFLKTLGNFRISLMITHTESFGYSFVDAVLAGTIPIVGPAMAEYFQVDCFPDLAIPIVCPNPDSPKEIARIIAPWLECSDTTYKETISELRIGLKKIAKKNNTQLKKILGGLSL